MLSLRKGCFQRQFWSLLSRRNIGVASIVDKPRVEQIITKVDNDVRRNGRIHKRDIDSVFEIVKQHGFSQPSHSLILLRCCGSLLCELKSDARNELADQVWSTIKASNVTLNISHYNALLNVYNENNKSFNPSDLLAEMESNGIEPNRVTYQRLLHRYCQIGDIQGALKILEHMKSKSLPLSEAIFNSLILGYARSGDLDSSIAVISQMENSNVEVTNNSFRILLSALCENLKSSSDVEQKLNKALKTLETKEVQMTDKDWLDVIATLGKVDENSPLIDTFMGKCTKPFGYNQDCFVTIMELLNEKKFNIALKLLYSMKAGDNAMESGSFGSFFIAHMLKSGVDRESVINVCEDLYTKGLNKYCYSKAAETAFEFDDLEESKFYFKTFLEKTGQIGKPHFVWPLLAKCKTDEEILSIISEHVAPIANVSSFSSIADTFSQYIWPKIEMDRHIFIERCKEFDLSDNVLVSSLIKYKLADNNLEEVSKIVNDERYFNPNLLGQYIVNDLSRAYAKTGDIVNMVNILKKFSAVATSSRDPVGLFLLHLLQLRTIDIPGRFVPLLNAMKDGNIYITSTYEEVINERNVLSAKEKNLVKSLVSERKAQQEAPANTVEELEKQYSDLLSRGILARGTVRQLVMAYCRKPIDTSTEAGRATLKATRDRVEQLLNELSDSSGSFTKALRALLVNFYVTRCEDLDAALKFKNADDSAIDVVKIMNLAKLMVSKGKVEDAIKLLNDEAKRDREHLTAAPNPRIHVDIVEIANICAEVTKNRQLVKDLVDGAVNLCKMKPNYLIFEPVVRASLFNNDFEKAFEDFTYYVNEKKCAPGVTDLMEHVIKNDDSEKLQKITDLSNSVQGDHHTLFDLAIALLNCGKIKQARKVTSTPGLRINERRLKAFSLDCIKNNKTEILEQAIPLLKNVFDINMDELYYDLLRSYAKTGNLEKGQELWTQMQEDNVILSDRTIRYITNFLNESGNESFAVKN